MGWFSRKPAEVEGLTPEPKKHEHVWMDIGRSHTGLYYQVCECGAHRCSPVPFDKLEKK